MSTATQDTSDEVTEPAVVQHARPGRRRWKLTLAGAVVVIVAGAGVVEVIHPLRGSSAPPAPGPEATSLATVTERSLSSQTTVDATLGYAGSYSVVVPATGGSPSSGAGPGPGASQPGTGAGPAGTGQAAGTFTRLPAAGDVVHQGRRLYSVSGSPVVLLYGSTPAYRGLSPGMSGADVRQLNADLVALGYATTSEPGPNSGYFSAATATALGKLQARLGVPQTGSLALGQAVFLPKAARVTSVSATLGAPAQPGAAVLQATSTTRQVSAQLDATQQSGVKTGDRVTITLPSNQTTPGVVTSVGTVATAPSGGPGSGQGSSSGGSSDSSGSSGQTATIEVDVKPTHPSATGQLDQAPVQVTITTATVKHALVVPVDALLAQAGGGYEVEVAGVDGTHHLVPVSLGIFDDADGLVQASGPGLSAGQHVVVPKI